MVDVVVSTMDSHPMPRGINYRFEYLVHAAMIQVVLKIGPIWFPFMVCFLFNLENIRVEKQQTHTYIRQPSYQADSTTSLAIADIAQYR